MTGGEDFQLSSSRDTLDIGYPARWPARVVDPSRASGCTRAARQMARLPTNGDVSVEQGVRAVVAADLHVVGGRVTDVIEVQDRVGCVVLSEDVVRRTELPVAGPGYVWVVLRGEARRLAADDRCRVGCCRLVDECVSRTVR